MWQISTCVNTGLFRLMSPCGLTPAHDARANTVSWRGMVTWVGFRQTRCGSSAPLGGRPAPSTPCTDLVLCLCEPDIVFGLSGAACHLARGGAGVAARGYTAYVSSNRLLCMEERKTVAVDCRWWLAYGLLWSSAVHRAICDYISRTTGKSRVGRLYHSGTRATLKPAIYGGSAALPRFRLRPRPGSLGRLGRNATRMLASVNGI